MNKNDKAFVVALVTNLILFVVFLSFFLFFRKRVPKIYQPRCDGSPNAPAPPPKSLFGWVRSTINFSDEQLFITHGMDALMFVKFVRMMVIVSALISIYGFVVLFPVCATGENTKLPSTDELHVNGLNSLTMSAMEKKSNRMIAHLFSVVVNTVIVFYFSFKLYRTYMKYRLRVRTDTTKIENYSVMVRGVPATLSDANLQSFFNELFPGKVVHVIRSHMTPKVEYKLDERNKSMRAVEKAWAVNVITGKRPTNKDKFLVGNVVDSIDWHTEHFNKWTADAEVAQKEEHPRANVVFVVFNDLAAASQCSTAVLDTLNRCVPEPAPEPRDLVWHNFTIGARQFLIRTLVADVFFFFLIFFWVIPVTFVSGLSNLETIQELKAFNWLVDFINMSPVITGFVQGFLPTLALIIFFAILVKVITAVVTATGVYSRSEISCGVMTKYYLFQVFNVLLVYSIAGTIFTVIQQIIDDPASLVDLLANSLPQQSGFFINYIMLLSLTGHPKSLWRPGPLIVRWIKHKFLSKTAREYREAEHPGAFSYDTTYTNHLLVFTILLVYSTLAPFIMIFGVIYFCMAFVSNKYNIVYVNIPDWEGGGKHWERVFNRIYVALVLYQIVLAGVFGIFKFIPGVIVSAICAVASIVMMMFIKDEFALSCRYLPLRVATDRSDFYSDLNKGTLAAPPGEEVSSYGTIDLNEKPKRGWSPVPERHNVARSSDSLDADPDTHPASPHAPTTYFQPTLQPITSQPELVIAPNKTPKVPTSASAGTLVSPTRSSGGESEA